MTYASQVMCGVTGLTRELNNPPAGNKSSSAHKLELIEVQFGATPAQGSRMTVAKSLKPPVGHSQPKLGGMTALAWLDWGTSAGFDCNAHGL